MVWVQGRAVMDDDSATQGHADEASSLGDRNGKVSHLIGSQRQKYARVVTKGSRV